MVLGMGNLAVCTEKDATAVNFVKVRPRPQEKTHPDRPRPVTTTATVTMGVTITFKLVGYVCGPSMGGLCGVPVPRKLLNPALCLAQVLTRCVFQDAMRDRTNGVTHRAQDR